MGSIFLIMAAFLASAVEMVEALTIVLAVGVTRGWRSTAIGTLTATVALAACVAVVGPALVRVPIDALRLVVGVLLLVFGLQWLRKAILRASGHKALHDEDAVFRHELEGARRAGTAVRAGMDWYAFTFGSAQGNLPLAAAGAAAAIVLVGVAGVLVHRPLSRVPENSLKFMVGVLLTTFGIFWSVEGTGIAWPGSDAAILGVLGLVVLSSCGLTMYLRYERKRVPAPALVAGDRGS